MRLINFLSSTLTHTYTHRQMPYNYYEIVRFNADTFPPPEEFYIPRIGPDEIVFGWSTVPHDVCPSFQYNTTSENCGTCSPSLTTSNMSICANFSNELHSNIRRNCSIFVRSIICSNITGDLTSSLEVNLRGMHNTVYIVGNFCMVQIFMLFADRLATAKVICVLHVVSTQRRCKN